MEKRAQSLRPRVVIIGAGVGGLALAISLKQKLGCSDFVIYEKGPSIGGTWRDNTYPGCACDVPSHYYSLSSDLNPNWSKPFSSQSEIRSYWDGLTAKYDLLQHIIFDTLVVSSTWNSDTQRYHVALRNEQTGDETTAEAAIVISALGILEVPRWPVGMKGLESFKGAMFHSARWQHGVQLKGKRVGVIGNGCSATQFLPIISQDPSVEVVNFCRTPSWFVPADFAPFSTAKKWMFANIPLYMKYYRAKLFFAYDIQYTIFPNKWLNRIAVKYKFQPYLLNNAPKHLQDDLIPKHPVGCKRIVKDTYYLDAAKRPNVSVTYSPIEEVVENGIRTTDGKLHELDVLICATGYTADSYPLPVSGVGGETIQGYYEKHSGPTAYYGTTIPGFPNFYMLSGPNTVTGHASVIFTTECQITYILQLVAPVLAGQASSFEVKHSATDEFNENLQRKLSKTVWTQCLSWYRKGGNGKLTSPWPGMVTLYWWKMLWPKWSDYTVTNGDRWEKERRTRKLKTAITLSVATALVAGVWMRWDILREHGADVIESLRMRSMWK